MNKTMEKQLSGMNAFVAVHLFQPTGFSPANCFLAIEEALIAHNGKDGDDHKDQAAFGIEEEIEIGCRKRSDQLKLQK